jgi:hypothetical protein
MKILDIYDILIHFTEEKIPTFIWGAPGIGKSSIVKKIAADHNYEFIDLRLSLLDPTDLKGIPFFDKGSAQAVWASPTFLPHDADSRGILFLDEMNTAAPSVQASAYQLVLDRKVGDYELPKGWSIVAAGNRDNDRGVTYRMPPPLANRFVHLELDVDFEEWKIWAYDSIIDRSIIGFLSYDKSKLFDFDPTSGAKSFPTPRSWEYVDKILKSGIKEHLLLSSISGAIGESTAIAFMSYRKVMDALPDIQKIVDGELMEIAEEEPKLLFALNAGIINALRENTDKKRIDNVIRFSMNLPSEFAIMLVKDAQKCGIVIDNAPSWEEWIRKYSYLLD